MRAIIRRQPWLFALTLVFIASRAFFYMQGLEMNVGALNGGNLGMQLADVELLRHDLWNTLYYLHAQPPLYNLFVGVVLKVFPEHYALAFQVLFALTGLASALMLFRISEWLCRNSLVAFVVSAWWVLNPGAILFENLLFYTYLVVFLLLGSAMFLIRYLETKQTAFLHGFFWTLAVLVLIRTLYHPFWILLCAFAVWLMARQEWRKILSGLALPLVLVCALLLKNYAVFHRFSFTTWLGIQYWRMMLPSEIEKRQHFVEQEGFSEVFLYKDNDEMVLKGGFENPYSVSHPLITQLKKSNGTTNFHCGKFDAANDSLTRAIMPFLKKHPEVFAQKIVVSGLFFFHPISSYWPFDFMKPGLGWYDEIFSTKFMRNLPVSVKAVPMLLVYAWVFGLLAWLLLRKRKVFFEMLGPERKALLFYMLFVWMYVFISVSLMDHGENMRQRLHVTPYFFAVAGLVVSAFLTMRSKSEH